METAVRRVVVDYEGLKGSEVRYAGGEGVRVVRFERDPVLERLLVEELRNGAEVTVRDGSESWPLSPRGVAGFSVSLSASGGSARVLAHGGRSEAGAVAAARRLLEGHPESAYALEVSLGPSLPPSLEPTRVFGPFRDAVDLGPGRPGLPAGGRFARLTIFN